MNNPLQVIISSAMRGASPMSIIRQMAGSDPRAAQALKMLDGKTGSQLAQMVSGIAQNYGTTPDAIAQSLGLPPRGVKK